METGIVGCRSDTNSEIETRPENDARQHFRRLHVVVVVVVVVAAAAAAAAGAETDSIGEKH